MWIGDAAGSNAALLVYGAGLTYAASWHSDFRRNRRDEEQRFVNEKYRLAAEFIVTCQHVRRLTERIEDLDRMRKALEPRIEDLVKVYGAIPASEVPEDDAVEVYERANALLREQQRLQERSEDLVGQMAQTVGYLVLVAPKHVQDAASDTSDVLTADPFDEAAYDQALAVFSDLVRRELGTA